MFVTAGGITKVGEFGLASLTRSFTVLAPSISHAGLSHWMSPELVNFDPEIGGAASTTASDVCTLSCALFEVSCSDIFVGV